MKKINKPTHRITFSNKEISLTQDCFGKTDLISCLREMMKDDFVKFQITTL